MNEIQKKEGLLKRLKNIESKNKQQLVAIKDQRGTQLEAIKDEGEKQLDAIDKYSTNKSPTHPTPPPQKKIFTINKMKKQKN